MLCHALMGKLLSQPAPPHRALMPLPSHSIPGCAAPNQGQCLPFQAGIQPELHRASHTDCIGKVETKKTGPLQQYVNCCPLQQYVNYSSL